MIARVRKSQAAMKDETRRISGSAAVDVRRAGVAIALVVLGATALFSWLAPATFYLWAKAIHVIAVISWMAGMLYLPRLFVYHAEAATVRRSPKPSR